MRPPNVWRPNRRERTNSRKFERRGHAAYFGEPVSQLEHALQTAHRADQRGVPDYLMIAALLHDIGHLLLDSVTVDAPQPSSVSARGKHGWHNGTGGLTDEGEFVGGVVGGHLVTLR